MRAYVFTDERLSGQAGRFVWLSINAEKDVNVEVLKKYPVNAFPTYFIIDPKQEKAALRYVGGASAPELLAILEDGKTAVASTKTREDALSKADELYGKGDYEGAAKEYPKALAKAPKGWPSYGRALGSYLYSLYVVERAAECTAVAKDALPKVAGTTSEASIAATGLDCALSLEKEDKTRAELVKMFEGKATAALAEHRDSMAGDDVSGVYQVLIGARADAGDEAGKKKLEGEWSAALDAAAAAAPDAEGRTVYDSHRLAAYIAIGQPEKAVTMLQQAEKELPEDYNPPARLAIAYKELKKWDEALQASDRALAKAYGPRKIVIMRARSEIHQAKGDVPAAKKTLEDAIVYAKTLPEEQGGKWVEGLQKRIDALSKPADKPAGS